MDQDFISSAEFQLGDIVTVRVEEDASETDLKIVSTVTVDDDGELTEYFVMHDEVNDNYALMAHDGAFVEDDELLTEVIGSVLATSNESDDSAA